MTPVRPSAADGAVYSASSRHRSHATDGSRLVRLQRQSRSARGVERSAPHCVQLRLQCASESDVFQVLKCSMTVVGLTGRSGGFCLVPAVDASPTRDGRPAIGDLLGNPRHFSPRSLRHAAITNALDAGVPLGDAQILARHADPRTTEHYDPAPAETWTATASASLPPTSPAREHLSTVTGFPELRLSASSRPE